LWSVAGYLSMVLEGVFGVEDDGRIAPKLPVSLVPTLFGERDRIRLDDGTQRYVLVRPKQLAGELLVAGAIQRDGTTTTVQLVPLAGRAAMPSPAILRPAAVFAPATPAAPVPRETTAGWQIPVPADHVLWRDGQTLSPAGGIATIARDGASHCLSLTRRDGTLESLHSPMTCVGPQQVLAGATHWQWTAPSAGRWRARLRYDNPNGPINTGVTAAVKTLVLQCEGQPDQRRPVVMPHSVGEQDSTAVEFEAPAGSCRIALEEGFNMSALTHFAQYNGGKGGKDGVLNQARVSALTLMPVAVSLEPRR
jgi:hypothetical protein